MGLELLLFYALAVVAVAASVLVVGIRSPIHSVMLLIVSFIALAGLYILLNAPFVAVIQIIIYAGAILVLFLFVVMLLSLQKEIAGVEKRGWRGPRRIGAVLSAAFAVELVWAVWQAATAHEPVGATASAQAVESVRTIGQVLYTDYAFPFEVTSLLIIVAMVGAVVLAKRHV